MVCKSGQVFPLTMLWMVWWDTPRCVFGVPVGQRPASFIEPDGYCRG